MREQRSRPGASRARCAVDIVFIGLVLVLFALTIGLIRLCESL